MGGTCTWASGRRSIASLDLGSVTDRTKECLLDADKPDDILMITILRRLHGGLRFAGTLSVDLLTVTELCWCA